MSNIQYPTRPDGAWWFGRALVALLAVSSTVAQENFPGVVKGFNATRYYAAPNFRQMEMKLTGAEATQLPGETKQFRITKPTFVSFEPTGATQLSIETPECIFDETDVRNRRVSSTERLAMRSGDGRFSIAGQGFLWRQNENILIISNEVRAVIQWTNNAPPLEITSRWVEFDAERGRGVFHDNVRGEDTDQVFTCETLTLSGSVDKLKRSGAGTGPTNRAPFDLIEADGGLVITGKSRPGHAKGQRGSFRQAEQRIDLIGDAEWSFDGYSGSADRMTAWLVNTNIDASGKVKLTLPRGALGAAGGLLNDTNAPAKSMSAAPVTITADRFTRRGEQLLVEGAVRIADGTNYLTCDRIDGKYTPQSPGSETAVATGNVFVGREGGGIYSDRADYSKATEEILFTGESRPRFVQGQVSGTAGRVIARPATREVRAEGDVDVTFPLAAGSSSLLDFLPNEQPDRVAAPNQPDQKVSITARRFRLHDRLAVFAGNVKAHQLPADGSEPRLNCGELEVRLAADRKHAESLQARQDVVCERGIVGVTNGPTAQIYTRMECETLTANANPTTGDLIDLVTGGGVRVQHADGEARGEQAIYTHADQLLRLIGKSVIDRPEVIYTSSQGLDYNLATKKVGGNYDSIRFKPAVLNRAGELEKLP